MLTKQSAAQRLALPHPFFADARFWGARLSDKPITVAFWRVAPSVRLSAFAILATGSLRAMDLRTRTSLLDHGLRIGAVFFRTIALATFAPTQMIFEAIVDLDTPITEYCKSGDELICGQRRSALRPVSVRL
jgi:hypothetical protein